MRTLRVLLGAVSLAFVLAAVGCESDDSQQGKACEAHTDCGEDTGEYCHRNAGGVYGCMRTYWCIAHQCSRDCTSACVLIPRGEWSTMDCSGSGGDCPGGTECGLMAGSWASGYFACR